jgi:large subunit ribosomal protein L9
MERKGQKVAQDAAAVKARIEAVSCVFAHRAGEEGKLFGAVTSKEIGDKLAAAGVEIDRKKIQLPEPIKSLGEYQVPVKLAAGVTANIKVSVVSAE